MSIQLIDYRAHNAAALFAAALKDIGFAVIANHPINTGLMDQAYQQWESFFHSQQKHQFTFDNKNHDGFISTTLSEKAKGNRFKDLKEFYHYYPWGRCPDSLRQVTSELYFALAYMAQELLNWIETETPSEISKNFSMPLSDMIKDSKRTLFRLIHYPPLTGEEDPQAVRAAPHEDINLITLLPAATAKGLEVQDTSGQWLEVPCESGWIIVNTGDMLQECTDFYYPSTTHRVSNPQDGSQKKSRLSMPLFLHPRDEVQLSKRYTAQSYRIERYQELGLY